MLWHAAAHCGMLVGRGLELSLSTPQPVPSRHIRPQAHTTIADPSLRAGKAKSRQRVDGDIICINGSGVPQFLQFLSRQSCDINYGQITRTVPYAFARCKQSAVSMLLVVSLSHTTFCAFELSADHMAKLTLRRQTRGSGQNRRQKKSRPRMHQFQDQCSKQTTPPWQPQLNFPL